MRRITQSALLALALVGGLPAQNSKPDCVYTLRVTAATPGAAFSNKSTSSSGTPCTYWVASYWTNGASSVSVSLQGTNDASGSAGASFTNLTATTGSNPATGTNQGSVILCCDYYPWIRVNPTLFNGTQLVIRLYGWRRQQ